MTSTLRKVARHKLLLLLLFPLPLLRGPQPAAGRVLVPSHTSFVSLSFAQRLSITCNVPSSPAMHRSPFPPLAEVPARLHRLAFQAAMLPHSPRLSLLTPRGAHGLCPVVGHPWSAHALHPLLFDTLGPPFPGVLPGIGFVPENGSKLHLLRQRLSTWGRFWLSQLEGEILLSSSEHAPERQLNPRTQKATLA